MSKASSAPAKATGKTLADFRAIHDRDTVITARIECALKEMEAENGPEHWEQESDFLRRAGVSQADGNKYREHFKDYVVRSRPVGTGRSSSEKNYWFATKAAAKQARPKQRGVDGGNG